MTTILVAAIALDSLTFALVWPTQEVNPVVLTLGAPLALVIRWSAVALLVAVRHHIPRRWLLVPALSGVYGAWSNVAVVV